MPEAVAVASALQFPEGPLILPGGEIGFCEIRRGTLSKIGRDGVVQVVAEVGGGPNGAALGPDGAVYIANNGGPNSTAYNGTITAHLPGTSRSGRCAVVVRVVERGVSGR